LLHLLAERPPTPPHSSVTSIYNLESTSIVKIEGHNEEVVDETTGKRQTAAKRKNPEKGRNQDVKMTEREQAGELSRKIWKSHKPYCCAELGTC